MSNQPEDIFSSITYLHGPGLLATGFLAAKRTSPRNSINTNNVLIIKDLYTTILRL
jgi:hypothetical protein